MRAIRAYVLAPPFVVEAPSTAKFLHIAMVPTEHRDENNNRVHAICVFAEVDEACPIIRYGFHAMPCDVALPETAGRYVGNCILPFGQGIIHFYEDTSIIGRLDS